jgi:alkane 1-monooxygenase
MKRQQTTLLSDNYIDKKRYAWILSLLVPAFIGAGPVMMLLTHDASWTLWIPLFVVYTVFPIVDFFMGEDRSNPPESAVARLEADFYYRYITYALAPILWGAVIFAVWFVSTRPIPLHGIIAMVLNTGVIGGFCINLGHELGHKKTPVERWLAKLMLAPTGYGHFLIEHNRGHHRYVATPEDPASSRMGETIYEFWLREMPGAAIRAWKIEKETLRNQGYSAWSWRNEILQPAAITLTFWICLTLLFGWQALAFIVAASFWANFQLTTANYIEHYGLLRKKIAPDRYELCQPHHSWNSNHIFSNWVTFHLQRHSDHHAHPLRRYQSLRHFDDLPSLPNGYFGMFVASYFPSLWFKLMDPRLVATVNADANKINFHLKARECLIKKYGLREDIAKAQPAPVLSLHRKQVDTLAA